VGVFAFLLWKMPETPRWLAQRKRYDEALQILTKINGVHEGEDEMKGIFEDIEKETHTRKITFGELFVPGFRTALMVGIALSLMSQWTGWSMTAFYMPTIYRQAGILDKANAILLTVIPNIANLLFTIIALSGLCVSDDRHDEHARPRVCGQAEWVACSNNSLSDGGAPCNWFWGPLLAGFI
jgi:hypothetical protein